MKWLVLILPLFLGSCVHPFDRLIDELYVEYEQGKITWEDYHRTATDYRKIRDEMRRDSTRSWARRSAFLDRGCERSRLVFCREKDDDVVFLQKERGSCYRRGSVIFHSDGSINNRVGDTWFHSSGSYSEKIGNTWYHRP